MKRKLVRHGPTTLMLSLPAHWVKAKGLLKGDSLDLTEQDGAVILRPGRNINLPVLLDGRSLGILVKRALGVHYKLGHDAVDMMLDPAQLAEVQKELAILPGFDIVEQTGQKYAIRDISCTSIDSFEPVLNKLLIITTNFTEQVAESLIVGNISGLREARVLEDTLNKFTNYALRLINKWGYPSKPSRSTYVYLTLWEWEKIGDELKFLCDHFGERKSVRIGPKLKKMLSEAATFVSDARGYVLSRSPEQAVRLSQKRKELVSMLQQFEGTKDELVIARHLLNIVQFCFNCVGTWLGTVY